MPLFAKKTFRVGDRVRVPSAFSGRDRCPHLKEHAKIVGLVARNDGSGVMTATLLFEKHREDGITHPCPTDWLERA